VDHVFDLGAFELQSGVTLPDVRLSYGTHGELNAARDNVIVYATPYALKHTDVEAAVGEGRALDPSRYFIVLPDTFGNGLSSSLSNSAPPHDGTGFPLVTTYDNVAAQHRLLTEELGVEGVELVCGYSMSAQQAFHWGALHSGFVRKVACICGSSKTSPHNWLFLEGLKRAMMADPEWEQGGAGLSAFATVYAGWFFSQDYYREGLHLVVFGEELPSMEAYLDVVTSIFAQTAPPDLLALLATWQATDISNHPAFEGDWAKALASITCEALVMPCRTDLYFPPEDNEIEVSMMPNATLEVIPSIWGHLAGIPIFASDGMEFIERKLTEFLQ
jgi:homoserine O-acetyltransferase